MLDILMPVKVEAIAQALTEVEVVDLVDGVEQTSYEFQGAIPCLEDLSDVPTRIIVCVDGGTNEDVELLRRYLPASSCEWSLMQNDGVLGYEKTLIELIKAVRNEFVAIVPANISVDDNQWFGKMQVVFTKDPHCFMVASDVPQTVSATMPPFRLDHKTHPKSEFFLTRRTALQNVAQFSGSEDFSRKAVQMGGTRWIAPGVRYGDADYAREEAGKV